MSFKITLRPACPEDAVQIVRIHEECWVTVYPDEVIGLTKHDVVTHLGCVEQRVKRLRAKLLGGQNRISTVFVAEAGGSVVGFLRFGWEGQTGFVYALYVNPDNARVGVGTALLQDAIHRSCTGACIELNVANHNEGAKQFYRSHGFCELTRAEPSVINGKCVPNTRMRRMNNGN